MIIKTNIKGLRDPFVLVENGIYYVYGTEVFSDDWSKTEWVCYKNESGFLNGEFKKTDKPIAVMPKEAEKNFWAPEVHKYKGNFYLFGTYYSSVIGRRGCSVFKSSSPEGPFYEITNGTITPKDWDCIDATLYVDNQGKPYMVFVREWVSTPDNIGRMVVAPMSDDLDMLLSEPKELFRADAPEWSNHYVTDGCFMYTCKDNSLLMLWSNLGYDKDYCVGVAKSKNGKIDGEWFQEDKLLFSKQMNNNLDGGHGMIFTALDGKKYLAIHSPNLQSENMKETPIFMLVEEKDGTLVAID